MWLTELDIAGQGRKFAKGLKHLTRLKPRKLNLQRLTLAEEDMEQVIDRLNETGNLWQDMEVLDLSNMRNISTGQYFGLSRSLLTVFVGLFPKLIKFDASNHEVS